VAEPVGEKLNQTDSRAVFVDMAHCKGRDNVLKRAARRKKAKRLGRDAAEAQTIVAHQIALDQPDASIESIE